jgi:hypothetical protein
LVDSGATTSFLSKNFVDQYQIKTKNLPPDEIFSVRLGNDSLESVDKFVEGTLFMGDNIAFAARPHIMRVLLEHAPFASGDESDIEEDEPDEPSHASNNSMSHLSDENNAILAAVAISEWSEPTSEAESTKAHAEANAADPHQLKRSSRYVACYCDDLIIVSDSAEAHKKHILELFRICLTRKFICSLQKVKCLQIRAVFWNGGGK